MIYDAASEDDLDLIGHQTVLRLYCDDSGFQHDFPAAFELAAQIPDPERIVLFQSIIVRRLDEQERKYSVVDEVLPMDAGEALRDHDPEAEIALAGVDAETGMVMLLYLDVAFERWKREGRMNSIGELEGAVMEGAVQRVRPKMMTVLAIMMGLLPIMWSGGTGSDVMKRIAAPMVGGVVTSFILELLIYPAIYVLWKWWSEVRHTHAAAQQKIVSDSVQGQS